ncbi:MAG: hypothetical protein HWN81_12850 [Candidatus Lokiarchaeota archaeon]|nr:hypothetical protein [Candidatus Lokiarchaeota archaeon]
MSTHIVESKLIDNNIFLVIPSWGNLLGYPTLGKYAHHNVSKISQDLVIFLGGTECAVSTEKGTLYFLFGLGYYYLKFELQSGRYITDNRQLTGLILSDFVYDHLATSKNITLENEKDVIVSENLFKLPIDLSHKTETKKTFIQGTLMRNLFIPYKDVFLELMETIQNPQSFQIEKERHMILTTHWDFYNQILISKDMELKTNYLQATAGLNSISLGVDNILNQYFNSSQLKDIKDTVEHFKDAFSSIGYDPMYLFSIIENGAKFLRGGTPIPFTEETVSNKKPKESILISAQPYVESFREWPDNFRRQSKEQLEKSFVPNETVKYQPKESTSLKKPEVGEFRRKEEDFELRTMQRPFVGFKPLPTIPIDNLFEILTTLKKVVEEDYDIQSIGKTLEIARDNIKKEVLHANFLWDMSKYSNVYQRAESNIGLSFNEKEDLLREIDYWIKISQKHYDKF